MAKNMSINLYSAHTYGGLKQTLKKSIWQRENSLFISFFNEIEAFNVNKNILFEFYLYNLFSCKIF
jgi:hypothetical protein